jgi:hypothetical protein
VSFIGDTELSARRLHPQGSRESYATQANLRYNESEPLTASLHMSGAPVGVGTINLIMGREEFKAYIAMDFSYKTKAMSVPFWLPYTFGHQEKDQTINPGRSSFGQKTQPASFVRNGKVINRLRSTLPLTSSRPRRFNIVSAVSIYYYIHSKERLW